jgi:hypothetical protein
MRRRDVLALAAALVAPAASAGAQRRRRRAGRPVRVALYHAGGVNETAFVTTRALLSTTRGIDLRVVRPDDVRAGTLDDRDLVFFTGGRGSVQARLLEEDGRERVRAFVRRGGGYLGICAGAYMAMQRHTASTGEFYKLALIASQNATGDLWERGVATVVARARGTNERLRLHYANGPVFERVPVDGLAPYVPIADFETDLHDAARGFAPGVMPGTPAMLAARYGEGRIILFSPNPALEPARNDVLLAAIRWAARPGPVPEDLTLAAILRGP